MSSNIDPSLQKSYNSAREDLSVGQTISLLTKYQSRMILFFLLLALIATKPLTQGLVAGGLVAWLATLSQGFMFRRLPPQADARAFFAMMVMAEVVKWLVVVVLIKVLHTISSVSSLGVVIGFITAYLSYFLLLLKG